MTTLGERIKFARDRVGLSQGGLAKQAKMSQTAVSKIENVPNARTTKLLEIAAACKVDPEWLRTGKGSPTKRTNGKILSDCDITEAGKLSQAIKKAQESVAVVAALPGKEPLTVDEQQLQIATVAVAIYLAEEKGVTSAEIMEELTKKEN